MSYSKFTKECNDVLIQITNGKVLNNIDSTEDYVRDKWIAEGQFKELISYILENWDSGNCDEFMNPILEALILNKHIILFKKLWKSIIRNRLEKLWEDVDYLKTTSLKLTLEDLKNVDLTAYNQFSSSEPMERSIAWRRLYIIDGIEKFIKGLRILIDNEEVERQYKLLEVVFNLEKPKPKPSTDKRKINEELFWELIEIARKNNSDQFEFVDKLKLLLENFQPKELRSFHKILLTKEQEINSWEHWALAYIVRAGCGDDEFDYFRIWAVSKGIANFEAIKNIDQSNLKQIFNEDPQLEELLYLAESVYESKTGEFMQEVHVKSKPIFGKKWEESNISKDFPTLCQLFDFKN